MKYFNFSKYVMIMMFTGFFLMDGTGFLHSLSGPEGFTIVRGRIVDGRDNPVSTAEVSASGARPIVKTTEQGEFVLRVFGEGNFRLVVYKSGYLPQTTRLFSLKPGQEFRVPQIQLEDTLVEEVVITGTATKKLYSQTPVKTFSTSTVGLEEKEGPKRDLADMMEIVPGVRLEDNCQNCNFTQIRMNGMEGKYSQILINGMPVVSALAGVYALEQIPNNMIDRIEVVKGGGSALYGGSAIAGVVNVLLAEPQKTGTHFSINQGYIDSEPAMDLNLNHDYISPNQSTRSSLFASYQSRRPVDLNGDGFSDLGKLENVSFGSNFSHYFSEWMGRLRLNFSVISENRRGGNRFEYPEHEADIAESIKTRRYDLGAVWEQYFSEDSRLLFAGYYTHTDRDSYYGAQRDPNAYGFTENPVWSGNLKYYFSGFKNHSLVLGGSYKSDGIDDRAPAYNRTIDEVYTNLGLFVQDEITVADGLSLLAGVRADRHSAVEDVIFSPRAAVSFFGLKHWTFRAAFSTGFRAPQVFDEDLHITQVGGEGMIIRNSDDLGVEKSHSFNLNVDFARQVVRTLFQFSLGGFYNRCNDGFLIYQVGHQGNTLVFERINSDGFEVYGMEAEAGVKIGTDLELYTNWTLERSRYDSPEPDFQSTRMFRTPDLYGQVRLTARPFQGSRVSLKLKYTGEMQVPHLAGYIDQDRLETTDPFAEVDLMVSQNIRIGDQEITLVVSALNLLNSFQDDLDRGIYRDAGYMYGPRYPRTFRLGFRYRF